MAHSGPAGYHRLARLCVHLSLVLAATAGPAAAKEATGTWRILALRVDFPVEETDEITTTGTGRFDLRSLAEALPDYRLPYDTPPHDRRHYELHLQALSRYYATVSDSQLVIESDVFPRADTLAYTLPRPMLQYGNGRTPEEIGRLWRDLAADAAALADADPEGPVFADYDSYLIIHAGLGYETGELNDIRSVFLAASDLADYGGPIPVDDGAHAIEDLWILPEAIDNRGRAGLNGLLAKFFGHQLGLPGLSNFADGLPAVGAWSLMDIGANRVGFVLLADSLEFAFGVVPPHPLAWTKAQLGWSTPTTVVRDTTVSLLAGDRTATGSISGALRIPLSPTESLWLENRQQRGRTELDLPDGVQAPFDDLELAWVEPSQVRFSHRITADESDSLAGRDAGVWLGVDEYDAFIPGSGVIAIHVDNAVIESSPEGFNNDRQRLGLTLKEADGYRDIGNLFFDRQDRTEGTRSDPFHAGTLPDGTPGVDRMTPSTTPTTQTNTGLDTGVEIRVLSAPGDTMQVQVRFARNKSGWPRPSAGSTGLQAADVDADGLVELIASNDEETVVLTADGSTQWRIAGRFLAADRGRLFVATSDSLFAIDASGSRRWAAADQVDVGVLVESGSRDVLVTGDESNLTARNAATGEIVFQHLLAATGLAAADVDGDGLGDVLSVEPDRLTISSASATTDLDLPGDWWAPAAGDVDGDGVADAVLLDRSGQLRVRTSLVTVSDVTIDVGAAPTGPPTLLDIDGDGQLEIAVTTMEALHVFTRSGLIAAGFPARIPDYHEAGAFVGEAVAGDMSGDGTHELFVSAGIGVYGYGADAMALPGFPALSAAAPVSAPVLADIDGDVDVELAVATTEAIYVWQPSAWADGFGTGDVTAAWSQAGGGASGQRSLQLQDKTPSPETAPLMPASRAYVYPNPADPADGPATVRFFLARDVEQVSLTVYDAIGTQMTRLYAEEPRGGAQNEIQWAVDDLASGLYLCRLEAQGVDGSRADVTLRMAVRQ